MIAIQSTGTLSLSQDTGVLSLIQSNGTLATKIVFDTVTVEIAKLDFSKSKNSMYIPLIFH